MSAAAGTAPHEAPGATVSAFAAVPWLGVRTLGALGVAALAIGAFAFAVTMRAPSAWSILGAGRGFVPEDYYPWTGFAIVLATTFGQFAGWAGGSLLLAHAWTLWMRRPLTSGVARLAMILVYLGLATLPLSVFHLLYGQPLLGLPREGLDRWLAEQYPDAHWLLYTAHPWVDLSIGPLAVGVIAILWAARDDRLAGWPLQVLLALLILATSFAIALSLAIHSILVHIRI